VAEVSLGIQQRRETSFKEDVGFEVFTAVTMKNAVFWDMALCGFIINQRFEGTCHLYLQSTTNKESEEKCSSTLKMEATRSSETLVYNKHTRCHIPGDGILFKRSWA
jgi:hypothetical protein